MSITQCFDALEAAENGSELLLILDAVVALY
jgi:hypothetical protein